MKPLSRKKKIIASVLIMIIVFGIALIVVNLNTWFTTYSTIKFGACNETYKNGKLITKECTYERQQIEKKRNPTSGWVLNWSIINKSLKN